LTTNPADNITTRGSCHECCEKILTLFEENILHKKKRKKKRRRIKESNNRVDEKASKQRYEPYGTITPYGMTCK